MLNIALAGTEALLLASGAAFLPELRTLLVADAHFGKAVSFRKLGVPVPEATTAATLAMLDEAIAGTHPVRLVFLGDFLHAARSHGAALLDAIGRWRAAHPRLELTLVRGNHDNRAGDPPPGLDMSVADEPLRMGPFSLCHHPQSVAGTYVLAGHWHPCHSMHGRGLQRLRLPCFWLGDDSGALPQRAIGVLPVFGAFTGMHRIQLCPGDRIFPIAGHAVRALPSLPVG